MNDDLKLFPIQLGLFPSDSHYMSGHCDGLSILAFAIQLMAAPGNLADAKQGQYFFSDSMVPKPRPASFHAWRALCHLGNESSLNFLVPFLPAIRHDEETGLAGSVKGLGNTGTIHLPSLTRRSKLHAKDDNGRIEWGAVYVGSAEHDESQGFLHYVLHRSDVPESYVIQHPSWYASDASIRLNSGLRTRLEFLAQHGIPALNISGLPIPRVARGLFRFLSQSEAENWAAAYVQTWRLVQADPGCVKSDWLQLLDDSKKKKDPGGEPPIETADLDAIFGESKPKKSKSRVGKLTFGDIEF